MAPMGAHGEGPKGQNYVNFKHPSLEIKTTLQYCHVIWVVKAEGEGEE